MAETIIKKYSLAFEKHEVTEYEAGASVYQLSQRYGITGNGTVARWVKQYGREGLKV